NGTPIDVIAVAKHLKSMDRMEDVGGANGLQRLMESTPDVHNAGYYASLIIEASNRRKLGEACAVASAKVRSNAADFEEIMGAHERDLHAINERSSGIQAVEC